MYNSGVFPTTRLRRLRGSHSLRQLVRETNINPQKLILPLFIRYGTNIKKPIPSMPGHYQLSVDKLAEEVHEISALGIKNVLLFGIPECKDPFGQDSYAENGIIQTAIPIIKEASSELLIITDICFCEYTDHGHCGVLADPQHVDEVNVDNDRTLTLIAKQAVSHAAAGADVLAPSGNMDGMVAALRQALDENGYKDRPILSYAVKYASAMYGPFREAAEGLPKFGNRRTYQLDYANAAEALRECALDITEGADMLMIKPAHTYLDIIHRVKTAYPHIPLGAYHTSGEFAMIKAAAEKGWVNEKESVLEVLTAIHRAGADFIFTYYAKEVMQWLTSVSANL